jgi:hypothetical protein
MAIVAMVVDGRYDRHAALNYRGPTSMRDTAVEIERLRLADHPSWQSCIN